MWGRRQRIIELELDVANLERQVNLADAESKRYNDRNALLQRQVGDAEQAREEANERAHDYARQIDHLAKWFQDNAPDKIGEGSAINNAIVLLNEGLHLETALSDLADSMHKTADDLVEATNRIGLQDAEIKELRIDIAAAHKAASEASAKAAGLDPAILEQVEEALDHPETFVKRNRPQRKS
jgi:chromosome segregation ATPase